MIALALLGAALGPAVVGPGVWRPAFPPEEGVDEIAVGRFMLDRTPVTNAEFLAFVLENPSWQRGRVPGILAEEGYLAHFAGPTSLGAVDPQAPVTRVSWFAARAFCAAQGGRLPLTAEWELAASASAKAADARDDAAFREQILTWYAKPSPAVLPPVGGGAPNFWGLYDMHGLVWEWTEDFNSAMVSVDSREQGGADELQFCGAGAIAAAEKGDYAEFMRVAFRSSLEGRFTLPTLGFRCAYSVE